MPYLRYDKDAHAGHTQSLKTIRAKSAIFKGLGVFAKSAKSFGFCFVQKKK
jgi:hypothetical protein